MSNNGGYTLDGTYPPPGKRVTNKMGFIECDSNGDKWLSHNKIIIKGSASDIEEKAEDSTQ